MRTLAIREPFLEKESFATQQKLLSEVQAAGNRLNSFKKLFDNVPFLLRKQVYDQLTELQNKQILLTHHISTCLQLLQLGLYDPDPMEWHLNSDRMAADLNNLKISINVFNDQVFQPKRSNGLL